jgi:hypothetical protein
MSDSAELVLNFSVLTCQEDQFMSDTAEILILTRINALQSNSLQRIVQLSDAVRQVCSVEQGQIFSLYRDVKLQPLDWGQGQANWEEVTFNKSKISDYYPRSINI